MSDAELNMLMGRLLQSQAHKCGSARSEIRVNTENKSEGRWV